MNKYDEKRIAAKLAKIQQVAPQIETNSSRKEVAVFNKAMVSVDLGHRDRLEKALKVAAAKARQHGASVIYMAVIEEAPSDVGRNLKEYEAKLVAFSSEHATTRHGIEAEALPFVSTDPATKINN